MIRADFLLFLGVATAAHLAIVPALDPSGRAGGGTAGQDRVTLAASAPTALVEHWETRPAPAENAPAMRAPTTGETPTRPASEAQARPAARPDRPVTTAAAPPPRVPQHVPAPARTNTAAPALPVPDIDAAPTATAQAGPPAETARPAALAQPVRPDSPAPPRLDTTPPPPSDSALAPDRTPRPAARPPAPAQSRPAQPAQAAAEIGSGETAGPAATQVSQGPDRATSRRLMAQWGSGVHRAIERRKSYPRGTRASGTVRVRLTLTGAGRLTALGVASSSGDANLDNAALDAVRAARYPSAPDALGTGPHSFTVPLSYQP